MLEETWGGGGGHSTQVGSLGPRERSGGIMVREMASASWSKVKSHEGDGVPLSREKIPLLLSDLTF